MRIRSLSRLAGSMQRRWRPNTTAPYATAKFLVLQAALLVATSVPVHSAETTTYAYDAKGRLVRVVKSGGPNSGTTTNYEHDKASNRKRVQTTGAPR